MPTCADSSYICFDLLCLEVSSSPNICLYRTSGTVSGLVCGTVSRVIHVIDSRLVCGTVSRPILVIDSGLVSGTVSRLIQKYYKQCKQYSDCLSMPTYADNSCICFDLLCSELSVSPNICLYRTSCQRAGLWHCQQADPCNRQRAGLWHCQQADPCNRQWAGLWHLHQ